MLKFILIAMLLAAIAVNAAVVENVEIGKGENYVIEDRNVSLVNSNKYGVIVCVNGIKSIMNYNNDEKIINDVFLELQGSEDNKAVFDIEYECDGRCICRSSECSNQACFDSINSEVLAENELSDAVEIQDTEQDEFEVFDETGEENPINKTLLTVVLILIVILLLSIVLIKRK